MVRTMKAKRFVPIRSEAWAACEAASGRCDCLRNGSGPCDSWKMHLRDCFYAGIDPATAEIRRIEFNRLHGTFHSAASLCAREEGS